MKNIWREGYTLTREDGSTTVITPAELRKINNAIDTMNGHDSLQFFLEGLEPDMKDYEEIAAATEEMMENEYACYDAWDRFMECLFEDSGDIETQSAEYSVSLWRANKNIDN